MPDTVRKRNFFYQLSHSIGHLSSGSDTGGGYGFNKIMSAAGVVVAEFL